MAHWSRLSRRSDRLPLLLTTLAAAAGLVSCAKTPPPQAVTPARPEVVYQFTQPSTGFQARHGDEIVIAGRFYRIGAPVVTWMDPGGYDAYRLERRFVPYEQSSWEATTRAVTDPTSELSSGSRSRYSMRYSKAATQKYTPETLEQIRGGGWSLEQLQQVVDQFVLHYDVCGTSRTCFKVLHDSRGLSVHFMLDIDGTIYQTLDLKEATWHATRSNSRSIGIEIANMGSYSGNESVAVLAEWYKKDAAGQTYIKIPDRFGGADAIRTKGVTLRPARNEMVVGTVQGTTQRMYDLTPQQYDSLIKLTAALCDAFPQIKCDYPRDASGKLITSTLSDEAWQDYKGVMGHYHVQKNKSDPGPAMQWDYLIENARNLLDARKARQGPQPSVKPASIFNTDPVTQPVKSGATAPKAGAASGKNAPPAAATTLPAVRVETLPGNR